MELLLSPAFIGLSLLSLLITGFHLWGLVRACRRHNASPIGSLCNEKERMPSRTMLYGAALYTALTVSYFLLPVLLHH